MSRCKKYYEQKIDQVNGQRQLHAILRPRQGDSSEEKGFKKAFSGFFDWFMRHRYLRYLVSEGRMRNKSAYLEYKNKYMLSYGAEEDACGVEGPQEGRT